MEGEGEGGREGGREGGGEAVISCTHKVLPSHHLPSPLKVRYDAKTTAIRDEACSKLKIPQFKYQLCEVKSSGEKIVLKENDVSVASHLSVNGRLFLVPRSHKEKTVVRKGGEGGRGVSMETGPGHLTPLCPSPSASPARPAAETSHLFPRGLCS